MRVPLGAPGRMIRISPWVCVKGPARCRLCPAGQTSRLWGADIGPREGALVPGGLGLLVGPCSPPVPAAATAAITAPGAAAMAASLWARSGYSGGLGGHPVLLARACRWRRAVLPQGVGACHRHLVELAEQQREGPILGAFAAAHDGLGGTGPNRGDTCGVHQGLGPTRRFLDEALPLAGQPCELLLILVEARVHSVLEVGRRRDLHPLLLLPEHGPSGPRARAPGCWRG